MARGSRKRLPVDPGRPMRRRQILTAEDDDADARVRKAPSGGVAGEFDATHFAERKRGGRFGANKK